MSVKIFQLLDDNDETVNVRSLEFYQPLDDNEDDNESEYKNGNIAFFMAVDLNGKPIANLNYAEVKVIGEIIEFTDSLMRIKVIDIIEFSREPKENFKKVYKMDENTTCRCEVSVNSIFDIRKEYIHGVVVNSKESLEVLKIKCTDIRAIRK